MAQASWGWRLTTLGVLFWRVGEISKPLLNQRFWTRGRKKLHFLKSLLLKRGLRSKIIKTPLLKLFKVKKSPTPFRTMFTGWTWISSPEKAQSSHPASTRRSPKRNFRTCSKRKLRSSKMVYPLHNKLTILTLCSIKWCLKRGSKSGLINQIR